MKSYTIHKTSTLGDLTLVADDNKLIGIYFANHKHLPQKADWKLNNKHPILKQAGKEITEYLEGERKIFSLPLHYAGTDFQQKVWQQIARIPYGKTISYMELAKRAGRPKAIRAAGTATGRNPLSIIIPCHRVIATNGTMGGFGGGMERKKKLLEVEVVLKTS